MDLGRAGLAEHLGELPLGGAPHDRVVDDHEPLAGHVLPQRVELHAHGPSPQLLARGDEAAADVAVLHQALAERDAAAPGEALRRGHAGLGHAHDHVGLDGRLLGELLADVDAGLVDALVVEPGVGAGEVDELEQAELGVDPLVGEGAQRPGPGGVDDDHLAGVELAHEVGADDVERGALRGQHPAAARACRGRAAGSRWGRARR